MYMCTHTVAIWRYMYMYLVHSTSLACLSRRISIYMYIYCMNVHPTLEIHMYMHVRVYLCTSSVCMCVQLPQPRVSQFRVLSFQSITSYQPLFSPTHSSHEASFSFSSCTKLSLSTRTVFEHSSIPSGQHWEERAIHIWRVEWIITAQWIPLLSDLYYGMSPTHTGGHIQL